MPSSAGASPATLSPPKLRTNTPTSKSDSTALGGKVLRKQISINAFPQPPRGARTSSLPPSPLSSGTTAASALPKDLDTERRGSADTSPTVSSKLVPRRKKSSINPYQGTTTFNSGSTPSLLNGSGEGRSISGGAGARASEGLLSLPSPPQSRSSSTQDSYSTSATNYEDNPDGLTRAEMADNGSPKLEGKGNVLVSVRVRPDAGTTGDHSKTDGEWMVDGRRSLVAYKGREGGDYFYGM